MELLLEFVVVLVLGFRGFEAALLQIALHGLLAFRNGVLDGHAIVEHVLEHLLRGVLDVTMMVGRPVAWFRLIAQAKANIVDDETRP